MPFDVGWNDRLQSVVHVRLPVRWTFQDLEVAKVDIDRLLDEVEGDAAILFEAPKDVAVPPNFLARSLNFMRRKHPRARALVLVNPSPYIRTLFGIFGTMAEPAGDVARSFATLEQAEAWLQRWRQAQTGR